MSRLLLGLVFASLLISALLIEAPPHVRAATLTVTSAADDGPGTLRAALGGAAPGDTIVFSPAIFLPAAPRTIAVRSALPTLDRNGLTIDASNAGVVLEGGSAGAGVNGLVISADNCVVRGLSIVGFGGNGIIITAGASGNTIGGDRGVGGGPHGQGNHLSANGGSGVDIRGAGADGNRLLGNFIGVDTSGERRQGNAFNGVAIWQGARGNMVGSTVLGQRNLISGNAQSGIWISRAGTVLNRVLGNIIGANQSGERAVGQGFEGIMITEGATDNEVGDGTPAGRNLLSGNDRNGVRIADPGTARNRVLGNYIGTNLAGTAAVANGYSGVEVSLGASQNTVGLPGQGNLLSGNMRHGLVITDGANDNVVQGNTIGPDVTASRTLGNQPLGGVDIADNSDRNRIGGLGGGEGNLISGNGVDGIAIFDNTGDGADQNQILGNVIGLSGDGSSPLPNRGPGISVIAGSLGTLVQGNQVAYNELHGVSVGESAQGRILANTIWRNWGDGVRIERCAGNSVSRNSVYDNGGGGIISACAAGPPAITGLSLGPDERVDGTAQPNATVEIFSGDDEEARTYEATVVADGAGRFSFTRGGSFGGSNLTVISTDASGNSSSLSAPAHLQWTLLLYFNGDNNLASDVEATVQAIVAGGPSPRANVLALVDLEGPADTALYDLTRGQLSRLEAGERNMGDGGTLVEFVNAGRARYPARNTMLSILDHGGGWAPGDAIFADGPLARKTFRWLAGSSGLSWDESSDYDYLGSAELREALAAIAAADGPLDVVFYDVCLMGMVEVAHQIQGYVDYFISSQNIAWLPIGGSGRYSRLIEALPPMATPRQVAELVVQSYAESMPPEEHPYSIAAVDMAGLPALVAATDQLAGALVPLLTDADQAAALKALYLQTQKVDYDTDLRVETSTEGFVDLYDFAARVQQGYADAAVETAAQAVLDALSAAVVVEQHASGRPWMQPEGPEWYWDLDNLHGLSIYLPLGEDLVLRPAPAGVPAPQQDFPTLRSTYSEELRFVAETRWKSLIERYYAAVSVDPPVVAPEKPVQAQLPPDITAPTTTITITGEPGAGQTLRIAWASEDSQSGVELVRFARRLPGGDWEVVETRGATAGVISYVAGSSCDDVAVYAVDGAGNVEGLRQGANSDIRCETALPVVVKLSAGTSSWMSAP